MPKILTFSEPQISRFEALFFLSWLIHRLFCQMSANSHFWLFLGYSPSVESSAYPVLVILFFKEPAVCFVGLFFLSGIIYLLFIFTTHSILFIEAISFILFPYGAMLLAISGRWWYIPACNEVEESFLERDYFSCPAFLQPAFLLLTWSSSAYGRFDGDSEPYSP